MNKKWKLTVLNDVLQPIKSWGRWTPTNWWVSGDGTLKEVAITHNLSSFVSEYLEINEIDITINSLRLKV